MMHIKAAGCLLSASIPGTLPDLGDKGWPRGSIDYPPVCLLSLAGVPPGAGQIHTGDIDSMEYDLY